ncbi:MAG: TolC family protein, partial [Thermoleophilia bacterium]|nr:TolC family protein [Thermoleophilia bacterium]
GDERLRLARLIGRPSGAASWRLEPFTPVELTGTPVAAWIDASLRARPEVQERSWEIAALGDELALTRLLPYDGAGAGVSVERDGDWRAGPAVSVPLPVFDTGQARAERVTAQQIEARHGLVAVRRQVVEDVRRAWESMALSRDNARRVRQELLPLQEQRRALAEASFRAGQSDVTALFLAEQALRAAQARLIQLDRDTAVAAVRLQRAAGGPGPAAALAGPAAGSAPQPSPTSPPTLPPPPTPIQ